jgi:hypothetical protein
MIIAIVVLAWILSGTALAFFLGAMINLADRRG